MKQKLKKIVLQMLSRFPLFLKGELDKISSVAVLYHNGIGIGDTLMISAMVKYLEKHFPEWTFFHVEDKYQLFKEQQYLSFFEFLGNLNKIDLIIIPEFSLRYLKYVPILHFKNFVGYVTTKLTSNCFKMINSFAIDYRTQHWMERLVRILELIFQGDIELRGMTYKLPFLQEYKKIKLPYKYIVFNPFTIYAQRGFSVSFFKRILDLILSFPYPVVLLGGVTFRTESKLYMNSKKIINLVGETNIYEAVYIIKNSVGYIGNDSGLMHIAFAFKKPVFAFFKSVNPESRKPFFYSQDNTFCYYTPCSNCPNFPCYDPINGHLYDQDFCKNYAKINWENLKNRLTEFFERLG